MTESSSEKDITATHVADMLRDLVTDKTVKEEELRAALATAANLLYALDNIHEDTMKGWDDTTAAYEYSVALVVGYRRLVLALLGVSLLSLGWIMTELLLRSP